MRSTEGAAENKSFSTAFLRESVLRFNSEDASTHTIGHSGISVFLRKKVNACFGKSMVRMSVLCVVKNS